MIELVDSHTHLDAEPFNSDRAEVLERARAAGVTRIVTIGAGDGIDSAKRAAALAEQHPFVWATAGVHPHDASKLVDFRHIETLAEHPRVVAIGETGLDFHYDFAERRDQERMFRLQIELARRVRKPLVIHSRNAGAECLAMLQNHGAAEVGGVFHCYAEDAAFAEKLREINFLVSFPGILTFKKSDSVRDAARSIPLEQIMIETDAPYLAPEPHRGKRCESAFVIETAKRLALERNQPFETVARVTTQNAVRLFRLGENDANR